MPNSPLSLRGRPLEDDASLLLRYTGGTRGILHASQVCAGEENGLAIKIYGSKASLAWEQERSNELVVKYPDAPRRIYRDGNDYLDAAVKRFTRIPAGHPEGFIEAFANIYREVARAIEAVLDRKPLPADCDFPTIDDGVAGMAFIETAVASARAGGAWTRLVA